jgi:zinc protease
MARRLTLTALLAGGLLAPALQAAEQAPLPKDLPPFGEDRPLPVPDIKASSLPNGLTVWLVRRPGFPKVTAVLAVRGGRAADARGQEGVAELLADTLKEGTATRSSRQIAEELQATGGEIGATAGTDAIYVRVDGLANGAPRLLEVLADVVQRASFPAKEVELAKENAVQGLEARESTPEFLGDKAFARALYGDHPYGTVAPTRETIAAATPDRLKAEFARRFRPDRALLVMVGELDPAAVSRDVGRLFGAWKAVGQAPAPTPPPPAGPGHRLLVVNRPGSVQSLILAGRPALTVTDPDYFPALVANTICSGAFSSRLVQNIREDKGYTYSPNGSLVTREKGGELRIRADVRNEVTGASLAEIYYELDRMWTTVPTGEEMERAKRYQAGLYLLRNQIQGSVAQTLAGNWVNGLPPAALGEFVTRVNAVTADQVRQVGRRLFPSSTQTILVVGDEPTVKTELAPFGEVTPVQP